MIPLHGMIMFLFLGGIFPAGDLRVLVITIIVNILQCVRDSVQASSGIHPFIPSL